MGKFLDSLKALNFLKSINCQYEFFATLYHISEPFEQELIDTDFNSEYAITLIYQILEYNIEESGIGFSPTHLIEELIPNIKNDYRAKIFIRAFLSKIDNYLAGIDTGCSGQVKTDKKLSNP